MPDAGSAPPPRVGWALPETLIGAGLLAFALVVLTETAQMPVSPLYTKVGPRVLPYMVAGGLVVLSGCLLAAAARGGWQPAEEREQVLHWRGVGFVALGLLLNVLLIGPLGFTAASTLLFVLVAYGFGSRQVLRDALIGLALALIAYFGFAQALGMNIGAGYVERLLGA